MTLYTANTHTSARTKAGAHRRVTRWETAKEWLRTAFTGRRDSE